MVRGANKSGARRRVRISTPGGTKERYEERAPKRARCVSGRPLPGVASGRKVDIKRLSKTQRRPSRPYAGVLSSPVMRSLFRQQVGFEISDDVVVSNDLFVTGMICMKIAGRDAGKYCVILSVEGDRVLIDGQTRRRLVNPKHLEPLGKVVDIKPDADSKAVAEALSKQGYVVTERVPQKVIVQNKKQL